MGAPDGGGLPGEEDQAFQLSRGDESLARVFREETLTGFQKGILGMGWGAGGILPASSSPGALRESHSCSAEGAGTFLPRSLASSS